jgi:archaetidylinositol phosphate synthase
MTPARSNSGLLARAEARVLDVLVTHVPRRVTPDALSALGLAGAVMTALGYAQASDGPWWLALACLGLVVNWLGDSLDGKLARERGPDRGIAGFMLDNGIDMLSYLVIAVGFALSGLLAPAVPFILLCLYLMLGNLALARLAATGVFDLAVGAVGTTELRVCFLLVAVVLMFVPHELAASPLLIGLRPLDLVSALWMLSMIIYFVLILRTDVRRNQPGRSGRTA